MAAIDKELLASLVDKAEVALSTSGGRKNLPRWIVENTRSPSNQNKNWSFAEHEWQIGVLNDQAPHIAIQKASQIGCSEVLTRMLLALAAKLSDHLMMVLPTAHFANKFVASRIDPILAASPRLRSLLSKKVDSSELKAIGGSHIHIGGAQSESSGISVPARALFIDEYSFCASDAVNIYQSRLGHQKPQDRIQVSYSTPLFPRSGISELFEHGTQNLYLCYHDSCGQWVVVDTSEHIVLPGWDKPLIELTLPDLRSGQYDPANAWVKCEHCGGPISMANLADPTRRAWVPKYPGRETSSYQVDPLCAPAVRPPEAIIKSLSQYRTQARWWQFSVGLPYEEAEGTITQAALDNAFTVMPVKPELSGVQGAIAGLDQGKISYLSNGKVVNNVLEVFNMETIAQDGENGQAETFLSRFSAYGCIKGVSDAGPDASLVRYIQNRTRYGAVLGAYYVRSARRASLELFNVDEEEGMVKANRTACLDAFVKDFNAGRIKLPKGHRQEAEIRKHLLTPKRITVPDAVGEEQSTWTSASADHWFFSLALLHLAAKLVESSPSTIYIPPSRLVSSVKMRSRPMPA